MASPIATIRARLRAPGYTASGDPTWQAVAMQVTANAHAGSTGRLRMVETAPASVHSPIVSCQGS